MPRHVMIFCAMLLHAAYFYARHACALPRLVCAKDADAYLRYATFRGMRAPSKGVAVSSAMRRWLRHVFYCSLLRATKDALHSARRCCLRARAFVFDMSR